MKFNTKILLFCFAVISGLFWGFTPIKNDLATQDINPTTEFNRLWQEKINSGAQKFNQLYTENAVKVALDGTLLEGRNQISKYYQTKQYQISKIETVKTNIAVSDSTVIYEIGHFRKSDKAYSHLILWRKDGKRLLRELELFAPRRKQVENQKSQIDQKRTEWMAVCNTHNTEKLVTEFYSNSALYYNHRPMIIGQKAIIEEYSYMSNPNYRLKLNPITFEMVNESLAFEIGQGSGSYNGNYVLIWQKDENGEWNIFFDSNI